MRVWAGVFIGLTVVAGACRHTDNSRLASETASTTDVTSPVDPEKYYAVLLDNGAVYYGKLTGYGTPFPTLRDVFYVQRTLNGKTKTVSNVLIRRGRELHKPDVMILNSSAITIVEPVGAGSRIAQLIERAQQNEGKTPPPEVDQVD